MGVKQSIGSVAIAIAVLLGHAADAAAQGAQLQLDHLSPLAARASNVVDVTVDASMLQLAAAFISNEKANEAAIKQLIASLKGVYVKRFQFDRDGAYSEADVNAVREQLKAPWARMVNVRDHGETFEVYIYRERETSAGLAIVVAEPRGLTVVNIVGPINLEQLGALGGQFGIPKVVAPAR